jgi:cytochrome c biogenesis protein CcmG/thiol:disulfide interchange protein DsbE
MTSKTATRARPNHRPAGPAGRRRRSSRNVLPAIVGLVGVMAIVAILIGLATGPADKASLPSQTGEVRVTGAALTPFAPSGTDPAIGRTIPEVRGAGFDGRPLIVAPGGTAKLMIFLAHWCSHCQAEVPRIVDWLAAGRLAGAELVAVSTGVDPNRPNYPPSAWLIEEAWTVPTIADDPSGGAAKAYGLTGYPYFVAVKADGTVAGRASGEQTLEQLQALIAAAHR